MIFILDTPKANILQTEYLAEVRSHFRTSNFDKIYLTQLSEITASVEAACTKILNSVY